MESLIKKVIAFLLPLTFGVCIYFSYAELSYRLQVPLANVTVQILGKDNLIYISQYFSQKDFVHVVAALSNFPLALSLSLFWVLLARNIRIIKPKISHSILVALIPFFVIFCVFLYLNIMRIDIGYEKSLINYAYGQMSDTLAAIFVPYYLLLLLFKSLLISSKAKVSNDA